MTREAARQEHWSTILAVNYLIDKKIVIMCSFSCKYQGKLRNTSLSQFGFKKNYL